MPKRDSNRNQNRKRNQNQNQIMNNSNSNAMSEEEFIARLSTLGGLVSTIGGIMSTAASFLALQKFQDDIILEEEEGIGSRGSGNGSGNDARIGQLENQIQYLIREIEELKTRKS